MRPFLWIAATFHQPIWGLVMLFDCKSELSDI